MPLQHSEPTTLDSLEHDELLHHLQIRKKRHPQIFYLQQRKPKQYIHHTMFNHGSEQPSSNIQFRNTLEQMNYLQNLMQEKMKAALMWHRHATEQFQRLAQHHHAHHMQRILSAESSIKKTLDQETLNQTLSNNQL